MITIEVTKAEEEIIKDLRSLPAYGKIEITADQNGKYDTYLVHKSEKKIVKS